MLKFVLIGGSFMKHNRNSLRSIKMLKLSFLQLLKEKDISKITVTEVTDLANLTRNTFYAHFEDVYAINEAIEDEVISKTIEFIDASFNVELTIDSLVFFKTIMSDIDKDRELLNALLQHGNAASFINKYSSRIIDHVLNNLGEFKLIDKVGFTIFLKVLFSGSVFIIRQYLDGELDLTIDEIAEKLNSIFLNCYKAYIE